MTEERWKYLNELKNAISTESLYDNFSAGGAVIDLMRIVDETLEACKPMDAIDILDKAK